MTRRLGIGRSILLLAVVVILAVVSIVWAVLSPADYLAGTPADRFLPTFADQLDQKIQTPPTRVYESMSEEHGDSSAYSCEADICFIIRPPGDSGASELASITEDIVYPSGLGSSWTVQKVDFLTATSYCFKRKSVAVSALHGGLDKATLLGKTDNCYVAVYEGEGPGLRP
jgi:hypothetical protein